MPSHIKGMLHIKISLIPPIPNNEMKICACQYSQYGGKSASRKIPEAKHEKVHEGNGQEMVQSERNCHSTNRGVGRREKTKGTYTKKAYRKPSEQLFHNRRTLSYPNLTKI